MDSASIGRHTDNWTTLTWAWRRVASNLAPYRHLPRPAPRRGYGSINGASRLVDTDGRQRALAAMASRPDGYYHAPDGEALAEIYRQIAVALPCPAGAFWGGR